MAIAQRAASPAAMVRVGKLIKVGFSPRQAFVLEAGSWTQAKLNKPKLFTRAQVLGLTTGTPTVNQLIRRVHLTRAQATLVKTFYLS